MAGYQDQHIDQGSHFRLELSGWGIDGGDPYDLTGATAKLYLGGDYTGDTRELTITDGAIVVELTGTETAALTLPTSYVVAVTLASGQIRHVLEGRMLGRHRNGWRWA